MLVFQRALRGGFERIDDGRFAVALLVSTAVTKKRGEALAVARERGLDRRDVALPFDRLGDRRFERRPVALGHDRENGAVAASPLSCAP